MPFEAKQYCIMKGRGSGLDALGVHDRHLLTGSQCIKGTLIEIRYFRVTEDDSDHRPTMSAHDSKVTRSSLPTHSSMRRR